MKYILAVSGGVDSVALLDMAMQRNLPGIKASRQDLIVAHFDHGIRKNSHDDCEFVRSLAKNYGLEFVYERAKLGENASEEIARKARYDFLNKIAAEKQVKIVTAHHQDDLIETILINLFRGTGWRGLAPFANSDILRPLLNFTKLDIVAYAITKNLTWVEDETNYNFKYFRNRVRNFATRISEADRRHLIELYYRQVELRRKIEEILEEISSDSLSQAWLNSLPKNVAVEVLRKRLDQRLTIPQTHRLLDFLKQAKSGDICQPGGHLQVGVYRDKLTISDL